MSANLLLNGGLDACVNCGADWTHLNPKGSTDGETDYCRCVACGTEDYYVFPKACLECGANDWEHYEAGDYPEDCPSCDAPEWGAE